MQGSVPCTGVRAVEITAGAAQCQWSGLPLVSSPSPALAVLHALLFDAAVPAQLPTAAVASSRSITAAAHLWLHLRRFNIAVKENTEVVFIDRARKTVVARELTTGAQYSTICSSTV